MIKSILLASTLLVAAPAFAQDKPATPAQPATTPSPAVTSQVPVEDTQPAEQQQQATAAVPPAATPAPTQTTGAQTAAVPAPAQPAAPAPAQTAAAPAPAGQAVATSPDQVAQAVSAGWATYDKDGNGALDKTEFAAWMVALRAAAQPGFDPQSPAAATWLNQAFAQADTDKSSTVNTSELTTFLTPKAG